MKILVRAGLVAGLLVLGAADVLIYWNAHLFYQSEKSEDVLKKIEILRKANSVYPLNDLTYYGLGKAYLDKSLQNPGMREESEAALAKAVQNLKRSIKLNPSSPFSHFYLAQALFEQSSPSGARSGSGYLEEYKKAAELATPNTEVSYEVGKAFVSLWPDLSERDRSKALDLVKEIFAGKNRERIFSLMNAWALNIGDFDVLEGLLPSDAEALRIYADFLGEKSLSVEARQRALAKSEFLEFEKLLADTESAERETFYNRWDEAAGQFKTCLDRLKRIHLYQGLVSEGRIEPSEFARIHGSILLSLAKCHLELGKGLAEVEDYLREYLNLEDRVTEVARLEKYLIERRFLSEKTSARFDDLRLLAFQLLLYSRQNRYAEIINVGRLLKESFVVVPGEKKGDYIRVLQVIGDAHQKAGNLYEANDFYQKAFDLDPQSIETMVRLRKNYESLNSEEKTEEISSRIGDLIPGEIDLSKVRLEKGRSFSQALVLDGRKVRLEISLAVEDIPPLVAIFFNDRIVWENSVQGGIVSLSAESRVGKNMLRITALNRPVSLARLSCNLI